MKPFKQGIDISFAQGLDTKSDPKRIPIGNFLSLENTIFEKGGLLQKRNGYAQLTSLPDTTSSYITTLNDNLTAVGTNITAYNEANSSWVERGSIQPMSVSTLQLVSNNLNQTAVDSVIASNGLICSVYLESNGSSTTNKYVIADSVTGQNIVPPTVIPVTSGTVSGGMRVFFLGNHFIIVFTNTISAVAHLQYVSISSGTPTNVSTNTDIAPSYIASTGLSFDGFVAGSNLYLAYNTTAGGQNVSITYLNRNFVVATPTVYDGYKATLMSVTADTSMNPPIVYASFYNSSASDGYTVAVNQNLSTIIPPQEIISSGTIVNLASVAQDGYCTVFSEVSNAYSFDAYYASNYIESVSIDGYYQTTPETVIRSVGLASKAFLVDETAYFLSAYQSAYQPTYFLINGSKSTAASPVISGKLAYENGGGYLTTGLPSVTVNNNVASVPYLYKDLIASVNKSTLTAAQITSQLAGNQTNAIYSQTGIKLGTFTIGTQDLDTAEIGSNLHLSGGFLWMYDGFLPVEHNFLLFPDTDTTTPTDTAVWSSSGGSMHAQPDGSTNTNAYYYQITYEWTDNVGNAFRSAPSVPVAVTTSSSGTSGSVTLNIPTLRLTAKTTNPVKIVIYRWSVAQQAYYQVTSITTPLLNSTTTDSVQFVDTLADSSILGNNLIYTTGGVVEDINAPASNLLTLFDTRLWLVDAEDPNLLYFSKQVIESVPVEMSDLLTMYIPPTEAVAGSTGPITAIFPMDDKLIIFKQNAIYYINGTGPDNTGANNNYSQPIFITSTVGCANQQSIVLQPMGLMFQSSKGIWLLDTNLNTSYIGAPVELYNTGFVESAQNIPATNQVRFILNTGITLMYDYYYSQWGTFTISALSSCIYHNLHTFINVLGQAFQEAEGTYTDGSVPVLMSFTTGPINVGKLQGYQRAYEFFLLGEYLSPHFLQVGISYNYDPTVIWNPLLKPVNYIDQGIAIGGSIEHYRVFLQTQRCQAFAISIQEIFDSSYGTSPGAGLTLSGINAIIGVKGPFSTISTTRSFG